MKFGQFLKVVNRPVHHAARPPIFMAVVLMPREVIEAAAEQPGRAAGRATSLDVSWVWIAAFVQEQQPDWPLGFLLCCLVAFVMG